MHVLHVMASGARGGGAAHLALLLPELARLGVGVSAAVGADGPLAARLGDLGVPVERVHLMHARFDPRAVFDLAGAIRRRSPDLVHVHGTRAAFYAAAARLACRWPPTVYTAHGLAYRKDMGWFGKAVYALAEAVACRAAGHVISVSRQDLADLERRGYLGPGRGSYVPNAIDAQQFASGDRRQARLRLGIPADAFVVGTVSRLVAQKSVVDLVDAVASLDDVDLVVVGDGPLRSNVEQRARRLAKRAHLLGARDDVAAILPAFDLFALSSRWEGETIALIEAMAAGLPCVATDTDGARELLTLSGAGVLVPIGDAVALANGIVSLRDNASMRSAMQQRGREFARQRSPHQMAEQVHAVYCRALGRVR